MSVYRIFGMSYATSILECPVRPSRERGIRKASLIHLVSAGSAVGHLF